MNMFKPTVAKTPEEYIDLIEDDSRRSDIEKLHEVIISTVPRLKPRIISGMIGYGTYHYRSSSGREGDWSLIALASQKNYISLYSCAIDETGAYVADTFRARLPKANIGKSCVRFKRLNDVDLDVIKELILASKKTGVNQI